MNQNRRIDNPIAGALSEGSSRDRMLLPAPAVSSRVGVVTVLYNSSSVLPGFLASVASQGRRDFHVWAVDNASADDSITQCLAQGSDYTVIANSTNLGVAAANNQGIHAALNAGCEFVLLLNNDVEFGSALFTQLIDGMKDNDCQMTCPIMYYFDRPNVIWAAGGRFQPLFGYRCYHLSEGVEDAGQFIGPRRIQHSPTCCVLFKRTVFETIGFMDERYFVYHDDTDFMLRCLKAGQRLYLIPQAKLLHKVSSLTGGAESEFSVRMGTRNRTYLLTKFLGQIIALPFVLALSVIYLVRHLAGRDSPERYELKRLSMREGYGMADNWLPYRS